jgi:hypothetical protein
MDASKKIFWIPGILGFGFELFIGALCQNKELAKLLSCQLICFQ